MLSLPSSLKFMFPLLQLIIRRNCMSCFPPLYLFPYSLLFSPYSHSYLLFPISLSTFLSSSSYFPYPLPYFPLPTLLSSFISPSYIRLSYNPCHILKHHYQQHQIITIRITITITITITSILFTIT